MASRRQFFRLTGAGLGLAGAAGARIEGAASLASEILRRATRQLAQRYLTVDYYRIRRALAYPLPVSSLSLPTVPVPTIKEYPWATWMLWALEERVHSLGWAAEWTRREEFRRAAARDLEALAGFPQFCQYAMPDLSSGHAGRLLWTASRKWSWVGESLRAKLRGACRRHADELVPLVEKQFGALRSKQDFLALQEPFRKLANIPLIGTVGAALTARVAAHPSAAELDRRVHAIFGAILDLRSSGHSEGVAYDGYILDFIADWLHALPPADRAGVLSHPNLAHFLDESYMLAAPGAIEEVAELSDVEPKQMPFHFSAQAKLEALRPDPLRAWYLKQWRVSWARADALAALHPLAAKLGGAAPRPGALQAHYAAVLRTGWEARDLAVAASCANSPMSHVQNDNGAVVIGSAGRWIIADPGYQQYMKDAERDFTLGPWAHNYPHPNGVAQDKKAPRPSRLTAPAGGPLRADFDLTDCYPAAAGARSVKRTVWLDGRALVAVADQVAGASVAKVSYHWHGHADAAWWVERGWVLLHLPEGDLWFTTPNASLTHRNLERHPGSRGQLTLAADVPGAQGVIWWVFALGASHPRVTPLDNFQSIEVEGKRFVP
jgi:hypothetical protein